MVVEIRPGVYWVGVRDWGRRLFDGLIPLPRGTTYNAYIVKGREKVALVDTVNPGFEREMEGKVREVCDLGEIDFLVMNHAEPDHAGAIPFVMGRNKKVMLVTTKKGMEMASVFYGVPPERVRVVGDGETIELGGKTLRFLEAPFLHWPETMFTYLVEDKILFPCDFFGAHTAYGLYDDEAEGLEADAKRYFGEIMMPFRGMGRRALEKLNDLDIEIIAPSHGPIYRNPGRILDLYRSWTAGEAREKAVLVYVSMWGSTERMVRVMADTLIAEGVEVCSHNLPISDVGELAKDLVDARAMVFGAPTVLGGMHPVGLYGLMLVKALKPPLKYAAVLSSYGWSGAAVKQALDALKWTGIEVVGFVEVKGPPTEEDEREVRELAKLLAEKIKQG